MEKSNHTWIVFDACSFTMENGVSRGSNTLRSLVRPVSPLSRLSQAAVLDSETQSLHRVTANVHERSRSRNRSRSPLLASAVHLASRPPPAAQPDAVERDDEMMRRVLRRSGQEITEPDFVQPEKSLGSRNIGPLHPKLKSIDRSETCPILVRLSYSTNGRHHSLSEYDRGKFPINELQINTWIDCSLKELADEIRYACPLARRRGSRLHFAVIYPDQRGTYRRRELGVVISGFIHPQRMDSQDPEDTVQRSFNLTDDSSVTLLSKRFHIGDYIDVAITEHVPGTLGGWTTGRRPLGPTPISSHAAANLI
ncbi:histone deacetylase complex subunit SAP18 [Paragonimus westermani]|uniref:18 kDa Sin3-associated polypeptide n=1 Tax=Paragonimus westermani TaxID=34504 RepID=A0A5J4NA13_9TREM|nr:histone deacetylase complex subunit SAP18 [Paragonimus westermani]